MSEIFWVAVTLFGDPVLWSLAIAGLVLIYFGMRHGCIRFRGVEKYRSLLKKFLLLIIPALLLSLFGSEALKLVFQVPRPCVPCPADRCSIYCPMTFSFPSGHTSTMSGIVTALFLLLKKRKYLLIYTVPVLIAASRIELGVHTVSDVIAGFFVGLVLTLLVWKYRKRIYRWEDEIL